MVWDTKGPSFRLQLDLAAVLEEGKFFWGGPAVGIVLANSAYVYVTLCVGIHIYIYTHTCFGLKRCVLYFRVTRLVLGPCRKEFLVGLK